MNDWRELNVRAQKSASLARRIARREEANHCGARYSLGLTAAAIAAITVLVAGACTRDGPGRLVRDGIWAGPCIMPCAITPTEGMMATTGQSDVAAKAPEGAMREANSNGDCAEIVMIGTLHDGHNDQRCYTPDMLLRLLTALRPAAIMVELDETFFEPDGSLKRRWAEDMACPENPMAYRAAQELGISLVRYDREGRNECYRKTDYFGRQKELNASLGELRKAHRDHPNSDLVCAVLAAGDALSEAQGQLGGQGLSAEFWNSLALDDLIRAKHALWHKIAPLVMEQDADSKHAASELRFFASEWEERNDIMVDNICRIAEQYRGRRLVVLTGCEHRYALRDRLVLRLGISLRDFWDVMPDWQQAVGAEAGQGK